MIKGILKNSESKEKREITANGKSWNKKKRKNTDVVAEKRRNISRKDYEKKKERKKKPHWNQISNEREIKSKTRKDEENPQITRTDDYCLMITNWCK